MSKFGPFDDDVQVSHGGLVFNVPAGKIVTIVDNVATYEDAPPQPKVAPKRAASKKKAPAKGS